MDSSPTGTEVTNLLIDWGNGDPSALEKLMPLVYAELRTLARRHLRKERPGQTLQTTDLVHEAFLKLVNQRVRWQNRAHFYAIAAQIMRRILVDRARTKKRKKRGGDEARISLSQTSLMAPDLTFDFVAFDEVLEKLAKIDNRKARIVELRFFGGLSVDETAEVLDISAVTVMRDWKMAKAWLHKS
jgi:RNA polymerase sigma-70 factor (ECF subfamily)